MTLPPAVRERLGRRFGAVRAAEPVGGGCINRATRVQTERATLFVKWNAGAGPGLFAAEARGLRALAAAGSALRVPEVLEWEDEPADGPAWLALEWLEPAPRGAGFGERLGRGLAALHRAAPDGVGENGAWGDTQPGYIGSLPQDNRAAERWSEFWRARRLEPQLRRARDAGRMPGTSAEWERLWDALPELLDRAAGEDGPSLLHGDLWGGNVISVDAGEPALVDPAAYRGHREVDLAMSELFGGFDDRFHAAYREAWPLRPGYTEARRGVYQLFYLLVHVNLFGGGYGAQTEAVLSGVLAA